MTYYYFDLFLLSVFFISLFYVLQKELKTEKNAFLHIALCAVLTAVFKYNWGVPFWGLEYEDAYAFSLCARQFGENGGYPPTKNGDIRSLLCA